MFEVEWKMFKKWYENSIDWIDFELCVPAS